MREVCFRTGSGLTFTVLPDRGLDIGGADYRGVGLAWRSRTGWVKPEFYEPEANGFLRSFAGGLMVTCGLSQVGAANVDDGIALGLHGRISNTPARNVQTRAEWIDDEYVLSCAGTVRETEALGTALELTRLTGTSLGSSAVAITDTIENIGFEPAPLMILYHFNIGYPLVSKGAEVLIPDSRIRPRDEGSDGTGRYPRLIEEPVIGAGEVVWYHDRFVQSASVTAAVMNTNTDGLGPAAFYVRYDTSTLPHLVVWRHPRAGINALGIEPATCEVEGRRAERTKGTVRYLDPGERLKVSLEWGVVTGRAALERLRAECGARSA